MNDSPDEQNSASDTPSEQLPGRHSQPYIAQQLDYDRELQQLVINQVLIEKIQQKIKQLPDNDPFTLHKAKYQLTRLQERCQALQDYIDHVLRIHDQIDPYPAYKEDLELNKATLAQRKIDYQEAYQALGLRTKDKEAEGQSLPPKQWSLEGDIGSMRPYYPQVTRPVASYPQAEQLQTVVTSMRFHNYSYTSFCYADDGTVLQDRFVLYWSFERDARAESQSSSRAIYRPGRLNAAVTHSGYGKGLGTTDLKEIDWTGGEHSRHSYQLKESLFPNGVNHNNDNPYSNTYISPSDIKLYKPTGFFAYPLDQGPFISQPLPKLAEIALPAYASLSESDKVVTELGNQPAPKNIYVHCTLPEWNHRLRKALTDLQEQINEYNVVVGPHLQKMNTLAKMQEMLELHTTHPYDPIDKDEGLHREELSRLLSELHQGIDAIVQTPTGDNNTTLPYYQEKQHIDLCAKALWKLISSKALYAELDHYIEHIEQLDLEEGEMPPGPYMAEEENWYEIFITLAECYAALSSSDIYGDLVWKEDIVHGINSLGKMDMALKGDQEMAKIFEDIAASLRDVEDSLDEVGLPEYLDRQEGSFSGVEYLPEPTQSLFNLIITKYEALAKPFVSNLVPGPGAPCTLQVILCCYQSQLMRHTLNRIKSDITYHLRYFKNVLYVLTVVNGRTGLGKLDTIDLRDILKALLVTRDHRASNGRAVNALDTLGKWLAGIDEGNDNSTSERVYQRALNSRLGNAATYGKALYSTFNLVLSIQHLQALEERAAEEGWSEDRIVLQYIEAFMNMALSVGTTTAALLNVAQRVKYLGFSQAVQKGLTGKIHARLAGNILDRVALPLSFVQGILSAYQAVDHLQEGEMKQAMMATITGAANIALSAGFIMRTVAKRLATQLVVMKIGAASMSLYGLGAVFILVGTAVNLVLLGADLVTAVRDFFASDSHKYFKKQWALFQSKPGELTADQIRKANLKVVDATRSNDVILLGTNVNSLYNKTFDIAKLYRTDIYEQYRTYYGGWGLVANPLKKAEDSMKKIDRLGQLSWRAIIPLYLQGFDEDFIEGSVKIDPKITGRKNKNNLRMSNTLHKISDFIEYYKAVKKGAGDELDNIPEEFTIVDARGQRVSIALLLEMGDFVAPSGQVFFQSRRWQHRSLLAPPE